jgi:NitT/TauT family transport system permease protein
MNRAQLADRPGVMPPTESPAGPPADNEKLRARLGERRLGRGKRLSWQLGLLVAFLAAWQWIPSDHGGWLQNYLLFLDPFYISSPSRVAQTLYDLFTASNGRVSIWPYLQSTVVATIIGFLAGLVLGAAGGLLLSSAPRVRQVISPFIVLVNSIPRIALIPVIVIIAGPTSFASIFNAVLVVFFLAFFNAIEGGSSVPKETIANVALMGASNVQIMRYVRLPNVVNWTFAVMPNAISFGLLTVVATELITGVKGLGSLILAATSNVDSSLSFAVVVLLSLLGLALYGLAVLLKRRVLRWQ